MQRPRLENGPSRRDLLFAPARGPARREHGAVALHGVALAALSLCACSRPGDKLGDAGAAPAPEAAVDAGESDDAATPKNPLSGKQIIRMIPGQKIGRIALGMPLSNMESLARDWTKEELDGGTISLRKSPWHVLVKDGIASEMTFTLDPTILPVVGGRTVPDSTILSDVVQIFPDCQPPKIEDGVEVVSCQGGQTQLSRKGPDGNIVIRFVTLPPAKTKAKRSAPK